MKEAVTLDSQILNTISLCERRAKYSFIDSIRPSEQAEALERGDLMHKMLEIYEGLRCGLVSEGADTWMQLAKAGFVVDGQTPIEVFTVRAARHFATKLDLGTAEVEEVIFQFTEYIKYYIDDPWETLAIESVGTKLLHEDEKYQYFYSFKIDRLARRDQIIAPWDYKTSKRKQITSSLSNQFIGYAWATDSHYVIVDKIGFQKTLPPAERFQRVILSYEQERIDEWVQNASYWATVYARLLENPSKSTMNLTSCDKYSGCIYRSICEKGPSSRDWIIERDYKRTETWDPAKALES